MKKIKFGVSLGSGQSSKFGVEVLELSGQNFKSIEKIRSGKSHFKKKRMTKTPVPTRRNETIRQ